MANFPIMVGNHAGLTSGTFRQVIQAAADIIWVASQGNREHPVAGNITFGPMTFVRSAAPGVGTSNTITIEKNGSSTALQLAFGAADTSKTDSDTFSAVAGDTIVIESTVSGTTATSQPSRWAIQTDSTYQQLFSGSFGSVSTSANRYWGIQEGDNSSPATAAALSSIEQVMPTSGTIQNLYGTMNNTITSGNYVLTLIKNGVATALTVNIGTGITTFNDTVHTVSFSEGDKFYWECVPNSPSNARTINLACEFVPSTANEGILLGGSGSNVSGTTYNNWYGQPSWDSTESNRQAYGLSCTIKKIYMLCSAAPGSGKSRTLTLRKNGSDTALSVTVSDANTTNSASTDVTIADGDLINIKHTDSGTPTTGFVRYGLVYTTSASSPPSTFTPQVVWI